jgi:hypothetical protein
MGCVLQLLDYNWADVIANLKAEVPTQTVGSVMLFVNDSIRMHIIGLFDHAQLVQRCRINPLLLLLLQLFSNQTSPDVDGLIQGVGVGKSVSIGTTHWTKLTACPHAPYVALLGNESDFLTTSTGYQCSKGKVMPSCVLLALSHTGTLLNITTFFCRGRWTVHIFDMSPDDTLKSVISGIGKHSNRHDHNNR